MCSAQGGEASVQSPGPWCVVRKHAGWSRSLGPAGGRARPLQAGVQGELQNKGTRFPLPTWVDLHPPVLGTPEMGLVLPRLVYYSALDSPGGKSARSSGAHFIDLETEEQRGRKTPSRRPTSRPGPVRPPVSGGRPRAPASPTSSQLVLGRLRLRGVAGSPSLSPPPPPRPFLEATDLPLGGVTASAGPPGRAAPAGGGTRHQGWGHKRGAGSWNGAAGRR